MKPRIAYFLLFCLIAPFFSTYIWLQIEKHHVKEAMKSLMIGGMDKSELALLKFTRQEAESELEWEHSREFEYNGQMYDVVEKQEQGDTTYYYCWEDKEETKLNRQLSELVANAMGKNPVNKNKQQRLNNFLKNLYCSEKSDKSLFEMYGMEIFPRSIHFDYSSIYFCPPAPPPELS